jgi:hypothetical protein
MENITTTTTLPQVSEPHPSLASAAFRRWGRMFVACLKALWAAWSDPRNCGALWVIGSDPRMWSYRK